mmetsp:Transcript_5265/g.10768  ORF Transcript_5265/g.10768 Transcript_5265/m.10768 type:complete len:176 (+) Transcript_5265:51-578(+)
MGGDGEDKPSRKKRSRSGVDEDASEKKRSRSSSGKSDGEMDEGVEDALLVSPIAEPRAGRKLTKKALKLVKKSAKAKELKRGIKEVVKGLRKGQGGLCFMASDVAPVDVIAHLPILCEETGVPYCYVASKEMLGMAAQTKRPTSVVVVSSSSGSGDLREDYEECATEIAKLRPIY